MNIREQLKKDLNESLKLKNELAVSSIRMVIGTIQTQEKSGKTAVEFTDSQIIDLIGKEVKKRFDTAEEYKRVGAVDRAKRELDEAHFLQTYLPELPSETHMVSTIDSIFSQYDSPTMRDMGSIMKNVREAYEGVPIDNKFVSDEVKKRLS